MSGFGGRKMATTRDRHRDLFGCVWIFAQGVSEGTGRSFAVVKGVGEASIRIQNWLFVVVSCLSGSENVLSQALGTTLLESCRVDDHVPPAFATALRKAWSPQMKSSTRHASKSPGPVAYLASRGISRATPLLLKVCFLKITSSSAILATSSIEVALKLVRIFSEGHSTYLCVSATLYRSAN